MKFEIPDDLRYTESHEWVDKRDGTFQVGITDFAQDELGDIVFVELPTVGDEVEQGEAFGVVESIKAVSDVYAPLAGTIVSINDGLQDKPELINEDPFEDGWMIELKSEQGADHLLSPSEYREQV